MREEYLWQLRSIWKSSRKFWNGVKPILKSSGKTKNTNVSGLLLYAKTQEALTPDCRYDIDGNVIAAKILDLNQEFSSIARQLDEAVEEYIG